jgi:hypothetical protein
MPPVEQKSGLLPRRTLLALFVFASTAFKILDASVPPSPIRRFGSVSGSFQVVDANHHLPAQVTLRALDPLVPYPGRQPKRRLFRCPVRAGGHWTCRLPPATYDLAVGAEGFVPQRRSGVVVALVRDLALGSFVLEPSQSIRGWLAIDGGVFDPAVFLLRVVPPEGAPSSDAPVYQDDPLLVERTVGSDGSFRITNVRPGSWSLEARCPGLAPALRAAIVVEPGRTTVLREPLLLRRTFDLEIAVEPPLDGRGRPWVLWVASMRVGANSRTRMIQPKVDSLEPQGSGLFRVPAQIPGRFMVNVADLDGSLFARLELEVADRSEARRTIRVGQLAVEGTVTRGGRPVEGSLYLVDAEGSAYLHLEVGRDGRFAGWLAKAGMWTGSFSSDQNHESPIRFEIPADPPNPAILDLRLPDTLVFGRVENGQGAPLREVEVHYRGQAQSGRLSLNEDGTFTGEGLPEGRLWLRASNPPLDHFSGDPIVMSELAEVELQDGHPVGPVVLRLRSGLPLTGSVTAPGGKAPPGQIWLEAVLRDGFTLSGPLREEGRFSFAIPADEERVTFLLIPANGPLRAVELAPGEGPAPTLFDPKGGSLHIELGQIWAQAKAAGKTLEVEQDGARIPLDRLLHWGAPIGSANLADYDDSFDVAALAPGHYRVCLGPEGFHEQVDPDARRKGGLDCATGTL